MPSDWERVAADPALLSAVRARYAGSGDVLDQLWWLEHPGDASPGGALDPAVRLERDRQARYRPDAEPVDADAVHRDEAAVAQDRAAARQALVEAAALPRPVTAAPAGRAGGFGGRTVAGALVAALAVGAVAGFAIGHVISVRPAAALAVFDRAQRQDDRPPGTAPLPSTTMRSSLRHLGSSATTGVEVYAMRSRDGRVCMVAVVHAIRYLETCATDAAFDVNGLSMRFEAAVDPIDDSGVSADQEIEPTWSPDGLLRF